MKFTALEVVDHHNKVAKALTLDQIKELLLYIESDKLAMRNSWAEKVDNEKLSNEKRQRARRLRDWYSAEACALHSVAIDLEYYVC